jgi:stearoyl-CoA desaturase (delta-9 desaturase)
MNTNTVASANLKPKSTGESLDETVDWSRMIPFVLVQLACVFVLLTGWSWFAFGVGLALYVVRMFAITGFYHRYFSHRTFKTSRAFQFVMAWIGASSAQRGPLWWAAHHRHHHLESDTERDIHSPRHKGFLMSHCGWFLTERGLHAPSAYTRDWNRYKELVWLDRNFLLPPLALIIGLWFLGWGASVWWPTAGTGPWQLVVWGFCISTTLTYHATYTINSLAHKWGGQRFDTGDDSRNNFVLAILTMGEGWHNNHHHYPASVRQGLYWWEIDITWYILWTMKHLGLIHSLRGWPGGIDNQTAPQAVRDA